jgi:WD40 repeat protein
MFCIRDLKGVVKRMRPRRRLLALTCTSACFLLLLGVVIYGWPWRTSENVPEPPIPEPKKERTLVRYGSPFAFSPDGNELLVTEEGNLTTPGLIVRLPPPRDHSQPSFRTIRRPWNGLAWSPDGKWLAYAGHGRLTLEGPSRDRILLLDSSNGEAVRDLIGHEGAVRILTFSPDSRKLVSVSDDRIVRLWETDTGKQLRTWRAGKDHLGTDMSFGDVTFSPDGRQLAGIDERCDIHLWDAASGELLQLIKQGCPESSRPGGVLFHPSGHLLVATFFVHQVVGDGDKVGYLRFRSFLNLWDLRSPARAIKQDTTVECDGGVCSLNFSRDGHHLIWLGKDDSLYFWSLRKRKIAQTFYLGPHCRDCTFSPDMRRLAVTNGEDGPSVVTTIWDMEPTDEQADSPSEARSP